ncbi:MAG: hypothetical protein LKJ66_10775 [Clostridium luticellarii]|uniref:hypothetical protein n=1 Tax=Clostridium luticellarii TaxID=1691940 RepID=UPI0023544FB5|nr:hypothetical protein [Clostridium luticellarii]MCI1996770.1 hypothetical protein [Clostridium luticellarii]MCI2040550.1 hypothetical protein [Clostridium luticellarii]
MYSYMHSDREIIPMCCYCRANNAMMRGALRRKNRSMFRNDEPVENRIDEGSGITQQPVQQMPNTGQQVPDVEQQMPDMMKSMSQADMEKVNSNTREIIDMFESHHPDIINTLICCGMSVDGARQYLSRVVRMALMHHMMHQT